MAGEVKTTLASKSQCRIAAVALFSLKLQDSLAWAQCHANVPEWEQGFTPMTLYAFRNKTLHPNSNCAILCDLCVHFIPLYST